VFEKPGHILSVNADPVQDPWLRLDWEHTPALSHPVVKLSCGIFHQSWKLADVPSSNVLLNDVELSGAHFIATGPDPFISLASAEFAGSWKFLKLLDRSLFLFISLLALLVLLSLHFILAKYFDLQFRPVYVFFLVIPMAYVIWLHYQSPKPAAKQADYLYFSAKSTAPATVTLFAGPDSITTWALSGKGYEMLGAICDMKDADGLVLKVVPKGPSDSVSFLAFNFYRGSRLASLYEHASPYCMVGNAFASEQDGALVMSGIRPEMPAVLHLIGTQYWTLAKEPVPPYGLIIAIFIFVALLVLVTGPSARYFLLCCSLSLFAMGLYEWLGGDIQEQLNIKSSTPQRSVESYFSRTPVFHAEDKFPSRIADPSFRTQVELGKHRYFRCDIDDHKKELNELSITLRTGMVGHHWEMINIPKGNMVFNDIDFKNGRFYVTGNDPYFALTSTFFVDTVQRITSLREVAFLILALIFLTLLLLFHKRASRYDASKFFLFVIFISIASSSLAYRFFNSDRVRLIIEKREAANCPEFKGEALTEHTRNWDQYLNDQLSGRNKLIPFNNYVYYSLFGELLDNPNVYFGKNGWFFYVGANGRESYENRKPVTEAELISIKILFEERRDWLKARGIDLYIIFPRTSQFIYEEELGRRMFRYHRVSKLDQVVSYLRAHSDLTIIDVETPLLQAKQPGKPKLYYRRATHWNYYGSYFAYAAIIDRIGKDHPSLGDPIPLEEIQWKQYEEPRKDMDLIHMAALTGYVTGQEIKPVHPRVNAADTARLLLTSVEYDFPRLYVVNPEKKDLRLVMFHDSFTRYLMPYLSQHFDRCAYFWTPAFNRELVREEQPDIVIWELTERFVPFYFIYKNKLFADQDRQRIEDLKVPGFTDLTIDELY
jgi:hypothetical protein